MKIEFRKATRDDIGIIASLAERIWKKHYLPIISMEQIEYMLKNMYSVDNLSLQMDKGHVFTLVTLDQQPVGYISISTEDCKKYFLHKFYIDISEQAKGIGTQLLDQIISTLKGFETIELTVNRANYKAINFYFKNGFIIKEVADFDIGNGFFMNDFVMVKKASQNKS